MSISPFHVWAIVRFLPDMQRVVVNRFRRRSDAEECLRVLRRATADRDYTLLYYPPGEESTCMVRKEYNKLVRDRIPEILGVMFISGVWREKKEGRILLDETK